ncbi:hypothetical protein D3C76_967850 [compost metagenome]
MLDGARRFAFGAPPAATVAEPVQAAVRVEARLLDRLAASLPRQATTDAVARLAQTGAGPGLLRAVPFDPGKALPAGIGHRRGVEIGALDQHAPPTVGVQAHDAVAHGIGLVAFLHRNQRIPDGHVPQVAIAALRALGDGSQRAVERLPAHLLVALLDPGHAIGGGAAGPAAIFVDPAAHRGARRRQLAARAIAVQVQAAARAWRIELDPQHSAMGRMQFGEVTTGGNRTVCAPLARPVAVGQATLVHALQIRREARSLRQVRSASSSGASSAWRRASRIFP